MAPFSDVTSQSGTKRFKQCVGCLTSIHRDGPSLCQTCGSLGSSGSFGKEWTTPQYSRCGEPASEAPKIALTTDMIESQSSTDLAEIL